MSSVAASGSLASTSLMKGISTAALARACDLAWKQLPEVSTDLITADNIRALCHVLRKFGVGTVPNEDTVDCVVSIVLQMRHLVRRLRTVPAFEAHLRADGVGFGTALGAYGWLVTVLSHLSAAQDEARDPTGGGADSAEGTADGTRLARDSRLCGASYACCDTVDTGARTVQQKRDAVLAAANDALPPDEHVVEGTCRLVLPDSERTGADADDAKPEASAWAHMPDGSAERDLDVRAHFVGLTNKGRMVVLVRGSSTVKDWLANAQFDNIVREFVSEARLCQERRAQCRLLFGACLVMTFASCVLPSSISPTARLTE